MTYDVSGHSLPALVLPEHNRLWLALSGGLDSVVLLALTVNWCQEHQRDLRVIHIHHGLSPYADQWAAFCQALCLKHSEEREIRIESECFRVTLDASGNVEEQARKARYHVFEQQLGADDLLLMAHHADDQAETMMLRLLRGAGSQGLSGMPYSRRLGEGRLLRPLLSYPRSQLEDWAKQQQLEWIEDESNLSLVFDRNYLRHQVMPAIRQRWPESYLQFVKAADNLSEEVELIRELAEQDLIRLRQSSPWASEILCCYELEQLSQRRQVNAMRHWLEQQGMPALEKKQWRIVIHEVLMARSDANPCFSWQGWQLRRFRNQLFCIAPEPDRSDTTLSEEDCCTSVNLSERCVQTGAFRLALSELSQIGFVLHLSSVDKPLRLRLPETGRLELRYRQGGEMIRLRDRGRRAIKKVLQESGVPPWIRPHLPLLWWISETGEERLIAVSDQWLAADWIAEADQSGWHLTACHSLSMSSDYPRHQK